MKTTTDKLKIVCTKVGNLIDIDLNSKHSKIKNLYEI